MSAAQRIDRLWWTWLRHCGVVVDRRDGAVDGAALACRSRSSACRCSRAWPSRLDFMELRGAPAAGARFVVGWLLLGSSPSWLCIGGFELSAAGPLRSHMRSRTPSAAMWCCRTGAPPPRHAHHQVLVGQLGGEVMVLLDQHDGHRAAIGRHADDAADVLDDAGLDCLSVSSSGISSLGPAASARDRRPLLLPSERSPPRRRIICLQHREQLEQLRRDGGSRGLGGQAMRRFIHRQAGEKISRPRGTYPTPWRTRAHRVARAMSILPSLTAAAHRHHAHQAFQQRGLADAIAAQHPVTSPRRASKPTWRRMWLPP